MKSRSMLRVSSTAALGALIFTVVACSGGGANAEIADATAVTIGTENITVIANSRLTSGPALSGNLTPERAATVRAQVGGSVLQTYADEGQPVRSGATLARIELSAISDAYFSARSALAVAQSTLDNASRDLIRAERLHAAGAIPERDLEQARWNAQNARGGLADAQARLASARKQVANTTVTAPFSGMVSVKSVSAGDVVQPGTALFTIVDPATLRLEASVPVDQLRDVRVGLPVTFTVTGFGDRVFVGRVTRVNPVVDPATGQVRITASIPNPGRALVGGLFASGRLATSIRDGLVAPTNAIDETGPVPTVLRLRRGRAERVTVTLGIRDESSERVEIAAGLAVGDTLIIGAARGITPGTPVRVAVPTDRPTVARMPAAVPMLTGTITQ